MKYLDYLLIVLFPVNLYLLGINYFTMSIGLAACFSVLSLFCKSEIIGKLNRAAYFIVMSILTIVALS